MDVEKLAQNAVISVKNSSRFSFEKTEEPYFFDLFCLDIIERLIGNRLKFRKFFPIIKTKVSINCIQKYFEKIDS